MNLVKNIIFRTDDILKNLSKIDFLLLFLIRIYLFFIFWGAGTSANKLSWNEGLPMVNPRFAEFLGPNGFTHGIGPGNVGLSVNMNI